MVLITENMVKILRLPEVQSKYGHTKRVDVVPRLHTEKEDHLPWQYITVRFAKFYHKSNDYVLLLKYMLQAVKADPVFKYNVMFQILPIVLHHENGMYYLILRIRVRKEILKNYGDFVACMMKKFNLTYRDDYHMAVEIDPKSTKYLYQLYTTEYIHTGRNPQHPPPLSPRFREQPTELSAELSQPTIMITPAMLSPATSMSPKTPMEQPMYALATMQREPPPPPMPQTFGMDMAAGMDENYYLHLLFLNEELRRMQYQQMIYANL